MVQNTKSPACNSYHHGDLRNALIVAAAELIAENGSLDFALIDAARRAGVSSAAPYRHFKDKDALLEAVTQVAFMALAELTRGVANSTAPGSVESIIAQGQSYIGFVRDHPEFYDLMWGETGFRAMGSQDMELKTAGFHVLVDTVQTWCDNNRLDDYDALELAVKLWSTAHGLASLAMNRSINRFLPEADVDKLLESSTRTFLEGVLRDCGQRTG